MLFKIIRIKQIQSVFQFSRNNKNLRKKKDCMYFQKNKLINLSI